MKKYLLNSFTIGILLTLVSFQIYREQFEFFDFAELKAYDFKVRYRGPRPVSGQVAIVAVDEKSLSEQGRWPWPRSRMATLVDKLSEAGVAAIGFDVLFPEPQTAVQVDLIKKIIKEKDLSNTSGEELINLLEGVADSDAKFADSLANSERSILGYFADPTGESPLGKKVTELDPRILEFLPFFEYSIIQRTDKPEDNVFFRPINGMGMSIFELASAANSGGFVSFLPEKDGVVRFIPMVQQIKEYLFPPLSLQLIHQATEALLAVQVAPYGIAAVQVADIEIPTNEKGDYLINWYGPGETFDHFPATDVLTGKLGPNELQGKIVIVGGTAAAIHDLHTTPFGTLYPGVEAHANIIENVLRQDFLHKPDWFTLLDTAMIFVTGIILSLVSLYFKALVMAVLTLIGISAYIFTDFYLFENSGLWISSVYPIFTQIFVYSGITLYRFTFEEREKRFIKGAFSQYLAPAVVNQLVGDPKLLKLGGERKVLTAFFSDVAGFSTISENLTPEDLVLLLNEYLSEMTDIIMKYEGTVDKFEGDAIIAFFGAPIPQEDHARRACLATLDMQKKLDEMRKTWKEQGKHELFMRIGLNTGPMVVGNMGSKTRMDYTMMGDSVNLAARLEGVNKQYGTYDMFSQFTYEQVKEDVEVRELDLIRVVGKSEPVRIYQLLCRKGELDEETAKINDLYAKGLENYRNQEWDDALDNFGAVLELSEKDGPSLTFFERCLLFQKEPPPADWDGVFSMKTK